MQSVCEEASTYYKLFLMLTIKSSFSFSFSEGVVGCLCPPDSCFVLEIRTTSKQHINRNPNKCMTTLRDRITYVYDLKRDG